MKILLTRTISGVVYVVLIIASILWGPVAFGTLFLVFLVISMIEFYKLALFGGYKPGKFSFFASGIIFYILVLLYLWGYVNQYILLLGFPFIFIIFIAEIFRKESNPFENISCSIFGLIYIVVPLSLINFLLYPGLQFDIHKTYFLFGFFLLIWLHDIFAYLTGILFGKHKLLERISPKKTWEGSIGGAVFTMAGAYVLSFIFSEINVPEWIGLSFIIIIFGTFGDLFESMIKRKLKMKDSGNIMPGHGGILDRLDSTLIAVPFVFVYFVLIIN